MVFGRNRQTQSESRHEPFKTITSAESGLVTRTGQEAQKESLSRPPCPQKSMVKLEQVKRGNIIAFQDYHFYTKGTPPM